MRSPSVPTPCYVFCSGFRSALESPFSNPFHTAIPPPAALCDISEVLTPLSHWFVVVGTYHNAAEWICQPLFSDNWQSVRQGSAAKQNPTLPHIVVRLLLQFVRYTNCNGFCRCFAFQIGKIHNHYGIIRNFQFRKFLPITFTHVRLYRIASVTFGHACSRCVQPDMLKVLGPISRHSPVYVTS